MKKSSLKLFTIFHILILIQIQVQAQIVAMNLQPILASLKDLRALKIVPLFFSEKSGVGYLIADEKQQAQISDYAHEQGRCGGFEVILQSQEISSPSKIISDIEALNQKNLDYLRSESRLNTRQKMEPRPEITSAIAQVSSTHIYETVQWLSSFPNRYNKSSNPNVHIDAFKVKLESVLKDSSLKYKIDLITHKSTAQKTVRVQILGVDRPDEIIILGGHLDSISRGFGNSIKAPGADDNASGSSNIFEALRIISRQKPPSRTLEFFWYAGEESGLLGSAEIAKSYKEQKKDVIAVLQLDMTMVPGSGPLVVGNVTDYTSARLRDYLVEMNKTYGLGIRFIDFECGYGCSDHASWYRQGYAAVTPFESDMEKMNSKIHTELDLIDTRANFEHSSVFAKIAIIFAMDLGASSLRP